MASNFRPDEIPKEEILAEVFDILGPVDEILSYNRIVERVEAGTCPVISRIIFQVQSERYSRSLCNQIMKYVGGEPWTRSHGKSIISWRFTR